jgi:hypothetical protein
MVKIGKNDVIFSSSFVMDKYHDNSATFSVPNQPALQFELKLTEKPAEVTDLPAERWHGVERVEDRDVVSFDVLPAGRTEFYSIGIGQATQGFSVQIVRQAIWNNVSMLVHVIVVREPR